MVVRGWWIVHRMVWPLSARLWIVCTSDSAVELSSPAANRKALQRRQSRMAVSELSALSTATSEGGRSLHVSVTIWPLHLAADHGQWRR
jgi:uroporphyrinogen-III synthase